MIEYQKEHGIKAAAVIGGGLLGLEAAKAMYDLGMETHIIEYAPILMCRQVTRVPQCQQEGGGTPPSADPLFPCDPGWVCRGVVCSGGRSRRRIIQ